MLRSMSAAAGVVCVRRRRRRVWSRVLRTSRRESSSTGEQSHTSHTHTYTVAHGIRVIACVCVYCTSAAAAIKTRPAESLATLPVCDRVCECCDVRVRVRACVYVCGRTIVRAGACAAGPGANDRRRAMPKLYRTACACVRVFSLFSYYYYYYPVVCGRDVRDGRAALSGVSVRWATRGMYLLLLLLLGNIVIVVIACHDSLLLLLFTLSTLLLSSLLFSNLVFDGNAMCVRASRAYKFSTTISYHCTMSTIKLVPSGMPKKVFFLGSCLKSCGCVINIENTKNI